MASTAGWAKVEAELAALLTSCAADLPQLAQDSETVAQATRARLAAEARHVFLESELAETGSALARTREDAEALQRRLDRVPSLAAQLVASNRERTHLVQQKADDKLGAMQRVASAEARAAELTAANVRLRDQLEQERRERRLLDVRHDSLKKQFQQQAAAARSSEVSYKRTSLQHGLQQRVSGLLQENADLKKRLQKASSRSSSSSSGGGGGSGRDQHGGKKSKKRVHASSSSSSSSSSSASMSSASSSSSAASMEKRRKKKRGDGSGPQERRNIVVVSGGQRRQKKKKKQKRDRDANHKKPGRKRPKLVVHER
jgi:hypothetical protein